MNLLSSGEEQVRLGDVIHVTQKTSGLGAAPNDSLNLTPDNYFRFWARKHCTQSVLSCCHAKLSLLLSFFLFAPLKPRGRLLSFLDKCCCDDLIQPMEVVVFLSCKQPCLH